MRRALAAELQAAGRVGQVEQRGDTPPGQLDAGRPDRKRDRRGDGDRRRPLSRRQRGSRDVGRADVDGQCSRAAVERRERCEDDARRRRPIEQAARLATDDLEVKAATDELGIARRPVGHPADQSELVRERSVGRARTRRDVRGEQLQPEPAIAADEPEPVALAPRGCDGGGPVDPHAELPRREQEAMRAEGERHRRRGGSLPALRQLAPGRRGTEPADVDAGDTRPAGKAVGRAREREPHRECEDDQEHPAPGHAGPEAPARGCAAACKDGRGGGGHRGRILAAVRTSRTRTARRRRTRSARCR